MRDARGDRGNREQILGRIRAAVATKAPRKEASATGEVFPQVKDLLGRFQAECKSNFIEVRLSAGGGESAAALKEVLESLPEGEIFVQDAPELRTLAGEAVHGRNIRWSSEGGPAEGSKATVSLCEALVAMTGSVMVSSGGCGGRGASVTAPCHIVIANARQLLPDLETALSRARKIAFENSMICLITGCSRTADIEKLLVKGAHGPNRVVVILQTGY